MRTMQWIQTGSFLPELHQHGHSQFTSRNIIFQNSESIANISLIQLIGFDNGRNISIYVEFGNQQSYDTAVLLIGRQGNHNYADGRPLCRRFDFARNTDDCIAALNFLSLIDTTFDFIKNTIISHVRNYHRENNDTNALYFMFFLNALLIFMTREIQHSPRNRSLISDRLNDEGRLILRASTNLTNPQQDIANNGFTLLMRVLALDSQMLDVLTNNTRDLRGILNRFRESFLETTRAQALNYFLMRPSAMDSDVFQADFGNDQTAFNALPMAGFYSQPQPSIPLSHQGKNATILSEIEGFDFDSVPKEFFCGVSLDVMDDPMIDPTTLNAAAIKWVSASDSEKETLNRGNYDTVTRYDQWWLEMAIAEKNGFSLTTGQPVTTPLIEDLVLKNRLEDFMKLHAPASAPSAAC